MGRGEEEGVAGGMERKVSGRDEERQGQTWGARRPVAADYGNGHRPNH